MTSGSPEFESADAPVDALESVGWGGQPSDEQARVGRIAREIERGVRTLADVEPAISIFSSARSDAATLRCCHEGLCASLHKPPLRARRGDERGSP